MSWRRRGTRASSCCRACPPTRARRRGSARRGPSRRWRRSRPPRRRERWCRGARPARPRRRAIRTVRSAGRSATAQGPPPGASRRPVCRTASGGPSRRHHRRRDGPRRTRPRRGPRPWRRTLATGSSRRWTGRTLGGPGCAPVPRARACPRRRRGTAHRLRTRGGDSRRARRVRGRSSRSPWSARVAGAWRRSARGPPWSPSSPAGRGGAGRRSRAGRPWPRSRSARTSGAPTTTCRHRPRRRARPGSARAVGSSRLHVAPACGPCRDRDTPSSCSVP